MANVTNRAHLIEHVLRALGSPLVEINITAEQMDDLVDDAISYFRDYYFDGIERIYFKHQVTQQNIDDGYIALPDKIFGVNRVFPSNGTGHDLFSVQYQMRASELGGLTGMSSVSMLYYDMVQMHLSLMDNLLTVVPQYRWNRITNKLRIEQKLVLDDYIVLDTYAALDPDLDNLTKFWNQRTFKAYCAALFKKQWGTNIKKYSGIQLPGGIVLDGQAIYDEGKTEADDIENEIMTKLAPLDWFIG